jgi:hypothetical protein
VIPDLYDIIRVNEVGDRITRFASEAPLRSEPTSRGRSSTECVKDGFILVGYPFTVCTVLSFYACADN